MAGGSLWPRVALAGAGALLVLFIVGPLLRLLLFASPENLATALRDPELKNSIALTVVTASLATLIAALLGIPLAYLLARRSFPGRRIILGIIDLPVVVPHPVAGIALLLFLGGGRRWAARWRNWASSSSVTFPALSRRCSLSPPPSW
jgi:molybdate/tungstate transport system permease protein